MFAFLSCLLVVILYLPCTAQAICDFVFSPGTRQKIPCKFISPHARASFSLRTVDVNFTDLVYELIENDIMIGKELNISLRMLTSPLQTNFEVNYEVNGKGRNWSPANVHTRQGGGYTVIYEKGSGDVLHVSGKGVHLRTFDRPGYPGVFINLHKALSLERKASLEQEAGTFCESGTAANDDEVISVRQTGSCAPGPKRRVELAVAFDNAFCSLHSNSEDIASAYIQAVINEADHIFRRDTCLALSLSHIEAHCNDPQDPYSGLSRTDPSSAETPSSQILQKFAEIWRQSRTKVHRDLAYFFSGFQDGTNIVGIAYTAATCLNHGYGWVENGDVPTLVHEIGHSLSASHSSEGVMKASVSHGDPVFFSETSVSQITEFIDKYSTNGVRDAGKDSSCLEESSTKCDATCPGFCTSGQCIAPYTASASKEIVPCTPVHLIYRCTKLQDSKYTLGTDCPSGFDFVLRSNPDLNVFCCLPPKETISAKLITNGYPFVKLNLNHPEGTRTYREYIQDTNLISNQTLIRSKLIPSCMVQSTENSSRPHSPENSPVSETSPSWAGHPSRSPLVSKTPSSSPFILPGPSFLPSVRASLSPAPSSSIIHSSNPISSNSIFPSPQPSAKIPPTPGTSEQPIFPLFPDFPPFPGLITTLGTAAAKPSTGYPSVSPIAPANGIPSSTPQVTDDLICARSFAIGQTFKCESRDVLKTKSIIRNADVVLQVIQRSGLFLLKIKVGQRIKIQSMAALITTTSGLRESDLGPVTNFGSDGVSEAIISADSFSMKVPEGMTTCCGQKLFVYASLDMCSAKNKSLCASTGLLTAESIMRCTNKCEKAEAVVPFSASLACPRCLEPSR